MHLAWVEHRDPRLLWRVKGCTYGVLAARSARATLQQTRKACSMLSTDCVALPSNGEGCVLEATCRIVRA